VDVGKLNGKPVKVLRDTGCTGIIVDLDLLSNKAIVDGRQGSLQMVNHAVESVPVAWVMLDTPYLGGGVK
jgi:hypothetical protein